MGIAVFYPSCKVRLFVRLENFVPAAPPAPPLPPLPGAGPELYMENPAFVQVADIVPFSLSYELNSYRIADTCRFEFPAKSFPLDPRIIRACAVQVFAGTISADDFAEAMGPNGSQAVVPDFDIQGRPTEVFRGVADKWNLHLDGNDRVKVEARDSTSVLIDAEITDNVMQNIPPTLPLDLVIQTLLQGDGLPPGLSKVPGLPGIRGLRVVNETGQVPLPPLMELKAPHLFDAAGKLKRAKPGKGKKQHKSSYWDLITDLCVAAGFICYTRLGTTLVPGGVAGRLIPAGRPVELVISTPRTYYGETAEVRTFFFGGNTDEMSFTRNLTGFKSPTIEVRAFGSRVGRTFSARFPPAPVDNTNSPSGTDREEIKVFTLKIDPTTPAGIVQLNIAASSIYEQIGRGEFEVKLKTKAMSILGFADPLTINNVDPDMFFLKPADSVVVAVNIADEVGGQVSEAVAFSTRSVEEKTLAILYDVFGGDPARLLLSQQIAAALESDFLQRVFRVQRINADWDFENGWSFEVDAINFLDVRNAVLSVTNVIAQAKSIADNAAGAVAALAERLTGG